MARSLTIVALVLGAATAVGCGSLTPDPGVGGERAWPPRALDFPREPDLDYAPMRAQVHAALPLTDPATGRFTGSGRIWIKGSPAVRAAAVAGGPTVALEPPHYVAVVEAPAGPVQVELIGDAGRSQVEVQVPDASELDSPVPRFSILSFSCFDPFTVVDGRPAVDPGYGAEDPDGRAGARPRLLEIRELLRAVVRAEIPEVPRPDLIVALGDQVYVEPAHDLYGRYGQTHPLSAWTVEQDPRPRLGLAAFERFLDELYRHTWSFTTLDEAFRRTPSVMVWDDHEIRDGWGSHGDEHVYRDTYYAAARRAFLDHQLSRGPRPVTQDARRLDAPLHQALTLHGVPIFLLDERSARDVRVPAVLGDEQWAELEAWLAALDPGRCPYYVLVSPAPLLHRITNLRELASSFDAETRDDVTDFWTSEVNAAELERVLGCIVANARRGLRAVILSGDMHLSAITRLAAGAEDGSSDSVLAYEIVTSGLAGRVGGSGLKEVIGDRGVVEADPVEVGGVATTTELGLIRSAPNFGGLEFDGGEVRAHVFQALEDGPVHYRVTLDWGAGAPALARRVEEGRRELPRGTGAR